MTTIEATTTTGPPARTLRVAGHAYPVVLPRLRDPRLHLASVIIALQVLGQTAFHFDLSIAQILVALLTSAVLEVVITFATKKVVAWPASAMLTGNGVAFVLRVPGTRHGDWWSMRGGWIFAATAGVSLLSKYVIRWHGRHIFNPSNFGLLACFLILGSRRADPLDFWWANMGPALATALIVIVVGGVVITRRTQMLGAATAFWLTFAGLVGVIAATGHCMTARWHIGPVCGGHFWFVLVTSPEILVFLFFMITDPKTAPAGRRARIAFGGLVAVVAAFLIAPQRTEFGTKVAVLGALAVLCAFRPLLERRLPVDDARRPVGTRRAVLGGVLAVCIGVPLLVVTGSHARSAARTVAGAAPGTSRPDVAIGSAEIPPVKIDRAVRKIDASLTPATARLLVRDLLADLVIEGDALKQRSTVLAATADAGPRYLKLEHVLVTAKPTDELVVTNYQLRTATVVLVHTTFQSGPQIAVRATGTIRRVSYRGSRATRVVTSRAAFTRTFVLLHTGGHYLIATDEP
jgi:Na+-translocating ferredoxin:NAD+ oxidoreductase RnfD subunit